MRLPTDVEAIYLKQLRSKVEIPENIGKIISIDIETGEFAVDADPLVTGTQLLAPMCQTKVRVILILK